MGKVKLKKQDIWIDMTPMSDVMVLLLCFFMLTSTFTKPEPVKVVEPQSVAEIKVPEKDVLNILVDKEGKVFMNMDNQFQLGDVATDVTSQFGINLSPMQLANFKSDPMFGAPMNVIEKFLNMEENQRREGVHVRIQRNLVDNAAGDGILRKETQGEREDDHVAQGAAEEEHQRAEKEGK